MADASPTPDSSLLFQRPIQGADQCDEASPLQFPAAITGNAILRRADGDDTLVMSSAGMHVSFQIHFQDPVELLPHVVDIESD